MRLKNYTLIILAFVFVGCADVGFRSGHGGYSGSFGSGFGSGFGGGGYSSGFGAHAGAKPSSPATMRPYTINGKTYYPQVVSIGYKMRGIASWYGPNFHGKKTSNGEVFNTYAMTAAHKTLPMNTIVRVTNLNNNKSIIVRINDRGPFVADRIIDLSKAGASRLDMLARGTAPVLLEVIGFDKNANKAHFAQSNANSRLNAVIAANATASAIKAQTSASNAPKPSKTTQTSASNAPSSAKPNPTNEILQDNAVYGGEFMVQVGAFKYKSGAISMQDKYSKSHKVKILESSDGLFRVFITGFKSEEEARDASKLIGIAGAFIIRD